jgi:hypothetical protein
MPDDGVVNVVIATTTNIMETIPCGYGNLRYQCWEYLAQSLPVTSTEVSAAVEVSCTHPWRSHRLQKLSCVSLEYRSMLNPPL